MSVQIRFSEEADAQLVSASAWWRQNRPAAPTLLEEEVAAALLLLADVPYAGRPYPQWRRRAARRLLLAGTRYHLYYVHDAEEGTILVLAIWSAVRGRGPKPGRSPRPAPR